MGEPTAGTAGVRSGDAAPAPASLASLRQRWSGQARMVQLISDVSFGDATSDDALAWQRVFWRHGFDAPIYARHVEGNHGGDAAPLRQYAPRPSDVVIYHYSIWSEVADFVHARGLRVLLKYHNVTPPELLNLFAPGLVGDARRGREWLSSLAPRTILATADSEYSRRDLDGAGFERTAVLPVLLDFDALEAPDDAGLRRQLADGRTIVLYVGRIMPNKRVEETIAAFAHYHHRVDRASRLLLVGGHDQTGAYITSLRMLINALRLNDSVVLTGKVSHARKLAYYRAAHVFLTMSEHEGFCVPLLEAMALGVPVIARAETAIPETAGGAAILVDRRRFDVIAELIHLARTDETLRRALVEAGRRRVADFSPARVEARMATFLAEVLEARAGVRG